MEGREIVVEVENESEQMCEEESISELYLAEEIVPASYTGCVDDYLKKGDELHQFKEKKKKEKKKLKPKEESPLDTPASEHTYNVQCDNLLAEPLLQSECFTRTTDGFNISDSSGKDDQT